MNIKEKFRWLLNKTGYVKQLHKEIEAYSKKLIFPPGHFYSPIVSPEIIKTHESEIWNHNNKESELRGINLNTAQQLELIDKLAVYYKDLPFKHNKQPALRYYFENPFYSYTDGIILYSMIRHFKPKQIIEIGSGFSSALMIDTNELFFNDNIQLTFIEPYTERLYSLISEEDKKNIFIIEKDVQNLPLDAFNKLEKNDFLFVDSSHVVKTGSDVNYILFKILPQLKSGVIIHFHDIFFPFEYPKEWVLDGYNWNEDYFLRAFMMYNSAFEILLFSEYLHKVYPNTFRDMPLCYKNFGGNCWITKIK